MFEVSKKEIKSTPVRHFQRGLEYESNQVHLWLLSHNEATAGFLVYFLTENKMVVHIRPPLVNLGPEVLGLASKEKMSNEAIFIAHRYRKMGGMKLLLSELFEEAARSHIREIDMIDINEKWLVEKLSNVLRSSGYDQIAVISPKEGEGGSSLIAKRGTGEKIVSQPRSTDSAPSTS